MLAEQPSAPPLRVRLAAYLALMRISNSPTVVTNALAGAAVAGIAVPDRSVWLVALAMVLFYSAGMVLNDVCDEPIDRRERPERPLPSGVVSRAEALVLTAGLFAVGSALLYLVGPQPLAVGLVLIGVIVVYDLWHKRNPLSPLIMACARLLVYVTAFAISGLGSDWLLPLLALSGTLLVLYVVGLTAIAKRESQPSLMRIWPAVVLFLPVPVVALTAPVSWPLLLFVGWVGYSVWLIYGRQRQVGRGVGQLIAGISLYDALVLSIFGSMFSVWLALGAWLLTLALQRFVRGT